MPLYEYHDPETGLSVELRRAVEDRDKEIVLRRSTNVPERLAVVGLGPSDEQLFDARIKKAYHKKEEKEGSRFRSGYDKKTIAKAWS